MLYSEGRLKDSLSFSDGLFSILKTTSTYMVCHLMFVKIVPPLRVTLGKQFDFTKKEQEMVSLKPKSPVFF